MTMDPDAPDARLRELLAAHHPPPSVPAEEVWDAMALELRRRTSPRRRLARRAALLAASLLLGLALGRWSARLPAARVAPMVTAPAPAAPAAIPRPYRRALAAHLAEAHPVLAAIERGAAGDDDRAARLLVTTRVLLASPAAGDPAAAALLRDMELVLAQAAADGTHVLAAEAVRVRGVLPRLRQAQGGPA